MKFSVLGLGPSIMKFKPNGSVTIGVNDIYRYHNADYVVIVDAPHKFEPERMAWIKLSRPKKVISHIMFWEFYFIKRFEKITLAPGRATFQFLDVPELVVKSNNSTFVAVVMAYKMGAKEIDIYGADFNNHPALNRKEQFKHVIANFKTLYEELTNRGIKVRVTAESALAQFIPVINTAF